MKVNPVGAFEAIAERQIRQAQERGEFDGLPGAGQPLADIEEPYHELWWLRKKLRGEQFAVLPDTLRLAREVSRAVQAALALPSEAAVRQAVNELNAMIRQANARVTCGPTGVQAEVDVADVLARWRAGRSG